MNPIVWFPQSSGRTSHRLCGIYIPCSAHLFPYCPTSLTDLPHEIIAQVLRIALDDCPVPGDVLTVCTLFRDLGTAHLYAHLAFTSVRQLCAFTRSSATAPVAPRSFALDLAGKDQRDVFRCLRDTWLKCQRLARSAAEQTGPTSGEERERERDVRLTCVRLRMHSYSQDRAIDVLEEGLRAIRHRGGIGAGVVSTHHDGDVSFLKSPDMFEWRGPDPEHHFSIAIVPPVTFCLFKQFSSWSNIREIIVTNISFATGSADPEGPVVPPLKEDVPSLHSLYIGQATFLRAQAVAGMFCQGRMARLNVIRLVDAYSESIWGPRLRRSDVERAVGMLCRTEEQAGIIARIKRVVTCEKKTESITGGDRVEDGTHILE